MRITQSMIARMGMTNLNQSRRVLAETQEQAATGRRINRPSDDPTDYRSARFLKDAMAQTERFQRSIDLARIRIQSTELSIADSTEIVSEAKQLAIQSRNGTNDSASRAALKEQVEQLFDRLLSNANTRAPGGGFIFSGYTSDVAPFVASGPFVDGSPAPTVSYAGDNGEVQVEIDAGVSIEVTLDGERVFQGGVDVFQVLTDLWTGLDQDDTTLVDAAIGSADLAIEQLLMERTRIGGSDAKADSFEERMQLQMQNLTEQLSFVEDADIYQVYSDLTKQEVALQSSLQVTSRLLGPTLLEYL